VPTTLNRSRLGRVPFPRRDAFSIGDSNPNTNEGYDVACFRGTRSHDPGTRVVLWRPGHQSAVRPDGVGAGALHGSYRTPSSKVRFGFKRIVSFTNPTNLAILALDAGSRIAFVLHHVLGYPVNEAAALAHIKQKEFRSHLRHAYVQLTSIQLGSLVPLQTFVVGSAQA
jgi:hypothetical protein